MTGPLSLAATMPRAVLRDVRGVGYELGAGLEYAALRRSPVFRGEGVADGGGLPVLLLPGFLTSASALQVLGRWLARNNYRSFRASRRLNTACGEFSVSAIVRRVERASAAAQGRKVALVGHSRGGHFARAVAARRPDLVAGVVTLGEPGLAFSGLNVAVTAPAVAVAGLGTVGVPGLFGWSCFHGECCERFRAEIDGPLPPGVPHIALHSATDGIVHVDAVDQPHAERREIRGSHLGMIFNPDAYRVLGETLAELPHTHVDGR